MRITESKLRSIIRSVIKESEDNDDLKYSEEKYPYHHKIFSLLEHVFNYDMIEDVKVRGLRGQIENIIENDFYDEGLSDLKKIPNFVNDFIDKGVYHFMSDGTGILSGSLIDNINKWEDFIKNNDEASIFNFIDQIYRKLNINSLDIG